MPEIWKLIEGSDVYAVSTHGRIRNIKTNKIKKPQLLEGYARVSLHNKTRKIHRLVAEAFIPNPLDLPEVNHKNGIKHYNRKSNLEWSTHEANVQHAKDNGLWHSQVGSTNGSAKLTEKAVVSIRERYATGEFKQSELAERHGVSQKAISLIVRREKWTHV